MVRLKKTPPVLCKFALFQLQFKLLDLSPIITVATRRRVTLGVGPKNSSHLECSRFRGQKCHPPWQNLLQHSEAPFPILQRVLQTLQKVVQLSASET